MWKVHKTSDLKIFILGRILAVGGKSLKFSKKYLPLHSTTAHEVKKTFVFNYVSATTVTKIVKGLKNTKATGVDGIQTEV